jgi:hypothetical protein
VSYQIGEVLLMEHHGWLKAFRVVKAEQVDRDTIEYGLALLELEKDAPEWIQP